MSTASGRQTRGLASSAPYFDARQITVMAKNSAQRAAGPARVRFIMVEAEMPDGDLTHITQAIQNALRPPAGATRAIAQVPRPAHVAGSTAAEPEIEPTEDAEIVLEASQDNASASARPKMPRRHRPPKVLDLDLTTEPSFASYAGAKNPTSDAMKYMVVAAWFKQHRSVEAITPDHVYTCYRAIKWPSDISDFAQPLRNLAFRQLVDKREKSSYAINHLGMAEVDKLDAP
jgi:hypothetical protein